MRLRVPGSKSMTQRALVMAALADAPTTIHGALVCDDSRHLTNLLRALGCEVGWDADRATLHPAPELRAPEAALDCGNAGTAMRFGACLSLSCEGALTLDGDDHMRARPIAPLVDSLAALGVAGRYLGREGCPPVRLARRPGDAAREVAVDTSTSSQYASGLAMVAPKLATGLVIDLVGAGVSQPYLEMTVRMMRAQGAEPALRERRLVIPPGGYRGGRVAVEPDWSAAAFLLAAGFVTGREVTIDGLLPARDSLQGDAAFVDMLAGLDRRLDAHGHNAFDLSACPDLVAPLAAVCAFAERPTRIFGVAHARVKESDRLAVLARGLDALGAVVRQTPDGLELEPLRAPTTVPAQIDPDGDHRMAMAFGVIGLRVGGIEIDDRDCVSKSFPDFWDTLAQLRPGPSTTT